MTAYDPVKNSSTINLWRWQQESCNLILFHPDKQSFRPETRNQFTKAPMLQDLCLKNTKNYNQMSKFINQKSKLNSSCVSSSCTNNYSKITDVVLFLKFYQQVTARYQNHCVEDVSTGRHSFKGLFGGQGFRLQVRVGVNVLLWWLWMSSQLQKDKCAYVCGPAAAGSQEAAWIK